MAVEAEKPEPELLRPDVHRWSPEEYHQLIESGGFDEDARIELIDGFLVDMSPKTREHEQAVAWLLDRLLDLGLDRRRYCTG